MEAASAPRPHAIRIPRPRRLLAALPDERLVEHIRRGEAAAFEVLYDRYSAGILAFCRHMLRSATDAEDATQHTFIAAHTDIQRSGDRQLHVKAWLYTIARNRCLSVLRARREQVAAGADLEIVSDRFSSDIEQRDDLRALLADVQKLPDDQREALVLAEVGALSHDEISDVIGCEASKVKSLVFQARTALVDRRLARETPCDEIREQIATLRGGALRRSHLRHHLDACPGCSEYREQIRRQRVMLAVALPVVPSAALRSQVLASVGLGGGSAAAVSAAGAGATVTAAGTGGSGLGVAIAQGGLAKLGLVAALALGGGGAAAVADSAGVPLLRHKSPAAPSGSNKSDLKRDDSAGGAATNGRAAADSGNSANAPGAKKKPSKRSARTRSGSGTEHGFTPAKGGSNGDAAKQFSRTRGNRNGTSRADNAPARTRSGAPRPTRVKRTAPLKSQPKVKVPPKANQPARTTTPKSPAPQATQPPRTTPEPAPQSTQPAPASSGSGDVGSITGRTLGSEKRNAGSGG